MSASFLVVGDVHGQWRDADRRFLESGDQDLALFVGDLGDEDVELVRAIAALRCEKAVLLGNHDAWASFSRKRPTERLQQSLEALGDDHLAYSVREVPAAGVSVVGARPFTWGGPSLRSAELYDELYGVADFAESAAKLLAAAQRAQHRDLVILAHNGPTGLGSEPHDPCGKDFGRKPGGDWGDPDLELALQQIRDSGSCVRCVVFGHMHARLANTRARERTRVMRCGDTVFVNAAVVPRLRGELAHYLRLEWSAGALLTVEDLWV